MSNRGGKREGAGGKPSWNYGRTKPVRVPIALAEKIVEIARVLDQGGNELSVTPSKTVDLTGVAIRQARDGAVVKLSDLVRAGYSLKPDGLMELANRKANEQDFELEDLLRLAEKQVNE
jgi:hypothetical protein